MKKCPCCFLGCSNNLWSSILAISFINVRPVLFLTLLFFMSLAILPAITEEAGAGVSISYSIFDDPGNESGEECGDALVVMDNSDPVQGYVVALCHDASLLTLDQIQVGTAATDVGAEFSAAQIFNDPPAGGTLGVVLDFESPFGGQTIPPGTGHNIAIYRYCCNELSPPGGEPIVADLEFCNQTLGNPLLDNIAVVEGLSIDADLTNGTFRCNPPSVRPIPTLSQWGRIITIVVLGVFAVIGIFAMRRRSAVTS